MKKMVELSFIGLFIFYIVSSSVFPTTTGATEGYVKDLKTGEAIEKAMITLVSFKSEALRYVIYSDNKGHFYRGGLTPGAYKILVEKEGYFPVSGTVKVELAETARVEIKLQSFESAKPDSTKASKQGVELINAGRYKEAINILTEAIRNEPSNPLFYYYRGMAFEKNGELDKALEDYQKAVELKPDFVLSLKKEGNVYAKKAEYEKAIELYEKSLQLGDEDTTTYYNFGVCLMNMGKNEEAKEVFEKLLLRDDSYSDAYYQLGIIYISLGDTEKAKELLLKFIEIDPENKNAALAKEILNNLQ